MKDPYFSRPEVSNSDLSSLKKLLYGGNDYDPTKAYADGSLLDAMITENHKIDYYNRILDGYTYSREDFENTKKMKAAFVKDELGKMILAQCDFQHIAISNLNINYQGFEFTLPARCKWDFIFPDAFRMGGDIKSTSAETQQQFEAACEHFDYFRSRAWYMDITGKTDKDILIGISKVNHKIFKITIDKKAPAGSKARMLYDHGKQQYSELAFLYWMFVHDLKLTA